MPGLGSGWGFSFASDNEEGACSTPELISDFHPSLRGLQLTLNRGDGAKKFARLPLVARACGRTKKSLHAALELFCRTKLGVDRRHDFPYHELIHKPFFRAWTGLSGDTRTANGTIIECFTNLGSEERIFVVEYSTACLGLADDYLEMETPLMFEAVSEKTAWGGYVNFMKKVDSSQPLDPECTLPFYLQWLVPDSRRVDGEGGLVMEIRGFHLRFAVRKSSMKGAGRGLFLTVSDISGQGRTHFALPLGELLDIGKYAPLANDDRKQFHVQHIKSYIHSWKNEVYVFDANGGDYEVFDITEDKSGELHGRAAKNCLARVNETDGDEIPTCCAESVPSGAVNYFLGHAVVGQGNLKIPVGKPCELKVRRVFLRIDTFRASSPAY